MTYEVLGGQPRPRAETFATSADAVPIIEPMINRVRRILADTGITEDQRTEALQNITILGNHLENARAGKLTTYILRSLQERFSEEVKKVVPVTVVAAKTKTIETIKPVAVLPVVAETPPPISDEPVKDNAGEIDVSADGVVDFSDPKQIEQYDQELLEGTKNAFSNQQFFKEHKLVQGLQALGTMRVIFAHWDRELQQIKSNLRNNKEVEARLYEQLNKHYDKIQDLIEFVNEEVLNFHEVHEVDLSDVAAIENVQTIDSKTELAITNKISLREPFILDPSMRAEEKSVDANAPQRLTMVSLPEDEQKEINEVHRMEEVTARMEAETAELQKLSSWRPASEAGNVTAMIDQFKRTLVNYYVQPSPALFERLQNTFGTIETLQREAKEAGVDMVAMLADVQSFERDLPRLERLPSTNTFERSNLRAFIENFRGLYARYIRAEAGEEKNILMRQLAKMHSKITEAHKDVLASVLEKPVTELESLKQEVVTLLKNQSLSAPSRQALSFVETDMLTRLVLLMPGDAEYNQLLQNAKEAIATATQLSEELPAISVQQTEELRNRADDSQDAISIDKLTVGSEVIDVPPMVLEEPKLAVDDSSNVVRIEGVANHYLAPETKKRLIKNPQLVAALLLATASVMYPDKLSELSETTQVASANSGLSSVLGVGAQWGGQSQESVPMAIDDVTKEEIRIPVRPYTSEVPATENTTKTPEENVAPIIDTKINNISPTSDVVAGRYGYTPEVLITNENAVVTETIDTAVSSEATSEPVELDPKSPAYQESIAPTELVASGNTVVEVLRGNEATFPDRAINPILAAVDATGIPEVLANKLRAEEKEAFLSDANRLKAAGVGSGQRGTTFPGEKINYSDPVKRLEQRFNEYRQYLNVPHTEVAESGDTRTSLTLESYARDLKLIPKEDQLNLASAAVEAYYATPAGREALNGEDKDTLKPGAVVPLQGVAPFLAAEIANYVRKTVAADNTESSIDTVVETDDESGGASEVIMDEVTSAENYPGGILEYSKAFNAKLESLGIAPKAPSTFDSWFQPRTADNRALLEMTVGDLNRIMMQKPQEVMQELAIRNIALPSANALNELLIEARRRDAIPAEVDLKLSVADFIQDLVLAEAPKSNN